MRRRFWVLLSVLVMVSGCSSAPTSVAGPETDRTSMQPSPSGSRSVLCDRTSFDLSGEDVGIDAGRRAHPELSDDLAALAGGLLPEQAFTLSGLHVSVAPILIPENAVAVSRGNLTINPGSDVAPAVLAGLLMMELTDQVVRAGGADQATSRAAANTVAVDTYIKVVTARSELGSGPYLRSRFSVTDVIDRLQGKDAYTRPALKKQLFAANPDYLAMLVEYFGSEYYHPDQTYPDDFDTLFPLPKSRGESLAQELSACFVGK